MGASASFSMENIILKIKYMSMIFEADPKKTILENLESQGFTPDYQCREGYCGCCRMKLLAGEVSYQEEPLGYMEIGDLLPCCSSLLSDIELSDL